MGNAWFIAEWIRCVLVHGFGFKFADDPSAKREDDLSFRPYGGTKNAELTWTLGKAVLFANKPPGADDYNLVSTPGLEAVATAHRQKLIDAMLAKAVRQEELLWDYITMAATFDIRNEVPGNFERVKRMVGLAEVAAQTSRALRREAMNQESQEVHLAVARAMNEGKEELALDLLRKAKDKAAKLSTTVAAPRSGEWLMEDVLEQATKAIKALGQNHRNYWVALIGLDADIENERQQDALARLREERKALKPIESTSKEEIKNLLWHVKTAAGNPLPGPAPAAITYDSDDDLTIY